VRAPPLAPRMPATETPALSRTVISMPTIVLYLRKDIKRIPERRHRFIALVAAAAILCGSVLLSGCQSSPPDTPKVIVIVASATANEPAPVLAAPDRSMLLKAANSPNVDAFVVDPNTGQASEVSLTPRRADGEVDYGPDRNNELGTNFSRVQQLLNALAASGPFDLLNMIAQAVRVTSVPGTLLVLSSGLSTAGGFDIRQVGWGADPRTVAISLSHEGLLPRLAGWHVVFSGLADTGGRQPALPLPQRTVLTSYWLALCQVAGAASCAVDAVTRPEPPARSTTPVPVVAFPQVTSFRGPQGQTTDVPADAFFPFDSARLLPGADAVLAPLAAEARGQYRQVTIVGYASPDGGTLAYNIALSAARAQAVKTRLIALEVPASLIIKAVGLGTAGQPRSACYRQGHLDEAICAQLRRVVITLYPAPTAAP
jgi:outer membrane protein OmpA-like peptidoglycan-associated protein